MLAASLSGTDAAAAAPFDGGAEAYRHVEAQLAFGPRFTGSPGHARTIDYLVGQLRGSGCTVRKVPFTSGAPGLAGIEFTNLLAWPGEPPAGSVTPSVPTGSVTLLAAHYDTLPCCPKDPDPARRNEPLLGANDGASGVAVLLAYAALLARRGGPAPPIAFAFLDGEERLPAREAMFAGSLHLADHLAEFFPGGLSALILLDMVGDADLAIKREGFSLSSAPDLVERIWRADAGTPRVFVDGEGPHINDDHVPFIRAGVPAVDLIDFDYPAWHTTGDTLDRVSARSLGRVVDVLTRFFDGEKSPGDGR